MSNSVRSQRNQDEADVKANIRVIDLSGNSNFLSGPIFGGLVRDAHHHDSCRVVTGSTTLLPTVGENQALVAYSKKGKYFVLPAISSLIEKPHQSLVCPLGRDQASGIHIPCFQEGVFARVCSSGYHEVTLPQRLPPGLGFVSVSKRRPDAARAVMGWLHLQGGEEAMQDDHIILVEGLRKTYYTGKVQVDALRGVDFSMRRGEMVAIMGPSGCGKTTLLNCLSGLDDIDEGRVVIEGVQLHDMSDDERTDYRARRMGFVFQMYNLLPVLR